MCSEPALLNQLIHLCVYPKSFSATLFVAMEPESLSLLCPIPARTQFSWDIKSVPWTDGNGDQLPYAKSFRRCGQCHDNLHNGNSTKIDKINRSILQLSNLYGRAKDPSKTLKMMFYPHWIELNSSFHTVTNAILYPLSRLFTVNFSRFSQHASAKMNFTTIMDRNPMPIFLNSTRLQV